MTAVLQEPNTEEIRLLNELWNAPTAVLPRVRIVGTAKVPTQRQPEPVETVATAADAWALVARAQAGDKRAFAELFDRYRHTVFRYVHFRVGNRQLAEDLTSDTFVRVLRRLDTFTWRGSDPGALLITIARNLVMDHFKSGRYRLEVLTEDLGTRHGADRAAWPEQVDRDPESDPASMASARDESHQVYAAIAQLTPVQAECIRRRFLLEQSVVEAAEGMQVTESALKSLQYRAVRALRRLLPAGMRESRSGADVSVWTALDRNARRSTR